MKFKKFNTKFYFILFLFSIFFLIIYLRIAQLMLFFDETSNVHNKWLKMILKDYSGNTKNENYYIKKIIKNKNRIKIVPFYRGTIYDSEMEKLAFSIKQKNLICRTKRILSLNSNEMDFILFNLSKILKIKTNDLYNKLFVRSSKTILYEDLSDLQIKRIKKTLKHYYGNKKILNINYSYKRTYPYNELLAQTIGFVSKDGKGITGLEKKFNELLNGKNFKKNVTKLYLKPIYYNNKIMSSYSGNNIVLTINKKIQTIVENEADLILKKYKPKKIMIIVTNPNNGNIKAIVNRPTLNLNKYSKFPIYNQKNYSIASWFEPGSTMKIVTASILENENALKKNEKFYCSGEYKIYNHTYHCYHGERHGWVNLKTILQHSCNIGTIQAVKNISKLTFYTYLKKFGFAIKTGSELPGEISGSLKKIKNWSGLSKFAISIGQGITVTALQLINSLSVVANGGYLYKPHIIKEIRKSNNQIIYKSKKDIIRRVIKKKTADTITDYLINVVENGTGKAAKIKGFKIAGKTGTAQIPEKKVGYGDDVVASFFGFFPAKKPLYSVLVVIERPKNALSGGKCAAPAFKHIAEQILNLKFKYPTDKVIERIYIPEKTKDTFIFENNTKKIKTMPNLIGLSKREVTSLMLSNNLIFEFKGQGYAYYQNIAAGKKIDKNKKIIIKFK